MDYLKIDGSFVRDIAIDRLDHSIVTTINQIAHDIGMETIAEYVEDCHIANELKRIGVDFGQGYGLGEPQPLTAVYSPLSTKLTAACA